MKADWRVLRGSLPRAPLTAGVVALLLLPATAAGNSRPLDRSFGTRGRVVTKTDLGGLSWLDARVKVAGGPNGTIVAAAGQQVFRFLSDGRLDPSFGEGGRLTAVDPEGLPFSMHDIAVDGESRIYLIGNVEIPDVKVPINYMWGMTHPTLAAVIRYTADGRLDSSFGGGNGYVLTDLGQPPTYGTSVPYRKSLTSLRSGAIDGDGDLLAIGTVGEFPCSKGHSELAMRSKLIVRLTPEGALDPSFGDGDGVQTFAAIDEIGMLAVGRYGEIAVAGSRTDNCAETTTFGAGRLRPDGSVDSGFRKSGLRALPESPEAVALDRFGRMVVLFAGWRVQRLTPNGALDRRFGHEGRTALRLPVGTDPSALVIEPSGRILLTGTRLGPRRRGLPGRGRYGRSFTVVRLNPQGHLDRRFGHRGWVTTRFGKRSGVRGEEAFTDAENRLVIGGPIARPDLAPTGGIALARYRLGR